MESNILSGVHNQKQFNAYFSLVISTTGTSTHQCVIPYTVDQAFKFSLLSLSSTFYGKLQRCILVCKRKIIQTLFQHQQQEIKKNIKQFNFLKSKLKKLTMPSMDLLKEGIIGLAMELNEFLQSEQSPKLLTQKILQHLNPLLRHFFVYKQYLRRKIIKSQKQTTLQKIESLSDRKIVNKSDQSDCSVDSIEEKIEAVQQIEKNLQSYSIRTLIQIYAQNQKIQMRQLSEICRICSKKIKIQLLQDHLWYCSKIYTINQEIKSIDSKIEEILKILREKQLELDSQINQFDENNKKQTDLLKILKMIQKTYSKRNKPRRSSLFGATKTVQINFYIGKLINDWLDQFSEDQQNLEQFQMLIKRKQLLQSQIESIQFQAFDSTQSEQFSKKETCSLSINSQHARQSFKNANIAGKKSIFAQQANSSHTISSDVDSSSAQQQKSNMNRALTQKKLGTNSSINSPDNKKNRPSNVFRTTLKKHLSMIRPSDQIQMNFSSRKCFSQTIQNQELLDIPSVGLKNFQVLKFLGKGAFGRVYLVRRKETHDLYALKVIQINQDWGQKELSSIKNQHNTFKKIAGDHLVKAPFSFTQAMGHFFIMEFIPGGDLGKLLEQEVYLQEQVARFYIAQIVLAIEHLHNFGVIHRDLKPENLVIDIDGHLKLTDFGLSEIQINTKLNKVLESAEKQQQGKLKLLNKSSIRSKRQRRTARVKQKSVSGKLIGTPDYIAPEIINKTSIDNKTIDWWSLGVIAYELLVGVRPFCGYSVDQIINNILEFKIEWPEIGYEENQISPVAQDFIIKLLQRNYEKRLGANGSQQIKLHKFFDGIDWQNIKRSDPPLPLQKINLQIYQKMPESEALRCEIQGLIKLEQNKQSVTDENQVEQSNQNSDVNIRLTGGSCSKQSKKKLKLDNFVRFDLLKDQTYQSAQRVMQQQRQKYNKLNDFAKSFKQLGDQRMFSSYSQSGTSEELGTNGTLTKKRKARNSKRASIMKNTPLFTLGQNQDQIVEKEFDDDE